MPVFNGLCHAAHLYTVEDVNAIVHGSAPRCSHTLPIKLSLLSPQTGRQFVASTAGELFEEITSDILTGGIYLDLLSGGILESISDYCAPKCDVYLFRSTLVSQSILAKVSEVVPEVSMNRLDFIGWSFDVISPGEPRTVAQSTLAIVGMSCRLPGGANDCKLFWDLLKEGRDTHTLKSLPTGLIFKHTSTPLARYLTRRPRLMVTSLTDLACSMLLFLTCRQER
jgi:hypothetical protein